MEASRALRHAISRNALLVCVAAIAASCGLLGPTHLARPAGTEVEVAVDNRSDQPMAMTLSQGGHPGPSLVVGPCEASNLIYPMEGRFTVDLGSAAEFSERPMQRLVESDDLVKTDGAYRLLIRIGVNGEVTFEPLEGLAPMRGAGC